MVEDFRNRASTCYHPVGSCMMGPDAATSVVDPQLKVHGLDHLYVVDASVFPNVTSGNTHAPTTMVAHKGAQAILGARALNPHGDTTHETRIDQDLCRRKSAPVVRRYAISCL